MHAWEATGGPVGGVMRFTTAVVKGLYTYSMVVVFWRGLGFSADGMRYRDELPG